MSTPGKVLIVLIVLASLVWMVLLAGVGQLNRNANRTLAELSEKIEKLDEDVKAARSEIVQVKDQTTIVEEDMDRHLAVIRSRQNDVERTNSHIKEALTRVQNQLGTLAESVKNAELSAKEHAAEQVAEQQALEAGRAEVESLKAQNSELMNRLTGLRNQFNTTLRTNVELLGKAVK
jgi:chromosome segregation ATPase